MADCECLAGCPFFNDQMEDMTDLADVIKNSYCKGDNSRCARYMVFKAKGKPAVPADLYPKDTARAQQIIDS